MNYEGDFRYVSGEWGDGFEPFERLVGRGVLDADLGPGWRTAAHPVLSSYPEEQRARAACYDVRVPLLHPALRPFRATSQVAAVVGDSLFVHAGLVAPHLEYATARYLQATRPEEEEEGRSGRFAAGRRRRKKGRERGAPRQDGGSGGGGGGGGAGSGLWAEALAEAGGSVGRAALVVLNAEAKSWVHAAGTADWGLLPHLGRRSALQTDGSVAMVRPGESGESGESGDSQAEADQDLPFCGHDPMQPFCGAAPALLTHGHGPVWLRLLSSPRGRPLPAPDAPPPEASAPPSAPLPPRAHLRRCLDQTGCKRMVVGHTPQPCINFAAAPADFVAGATPRFVRGGAVPVEKKEEEEEVQVWRVDTGCGAFVAEGVREALEIAQAAPVSEGGYDPQVSVLVRAPPERGVASPLSVAAILGLGGQQKESSPQSPAALGKDGLWRVPARLRRAPVDLRTVDWLPRDLE